MGPISTQNLTSTILLSTNLTNQTPSWNTNSVQYNPALNVFKGANQISNYQSYHPTSSNWISSSSSSNATTQFGGDNYAWNRK
jgi:hypothetical protein